MPPEYKRLGKLVAEQNEHFDQHGRSAGISSVVVELFECDQCYSVVVYDSIPNHTSWHQSLKNES